jgi:AsmA protein
MQATRRRHPFRPFLLGAGAVVIVGVAAVVVASAALNPDRLRDELKDAVLRSTGRELSVAGGVHLRIGLAPQVEVDDIALANVAGGSRPQMVRAKSLVVRLALLPLLGGDAVVSSLVLNDPDIVLERGADGAPNWQFVAARRALYQSRGATSAGRDGGGGGGGGGDHRVEISRLEVQGGQVSWQGASGPPLTVGIKRLVWSANDIDAPMALSFEGTRGDVPVTLTASSGSLQRLQGGPVSALAGAWPVTVDATALGATLHVAGGVNHPEQWRGYTLRLTANAPSLDALSPLLGIGGLPPMADVNAAAVLQDGAQGELRTSQVSVHAGESDLSRWVPGLAVKQALLSAPGPGQLAQLSLDGTYQQQKLRVAATAMQPDVVGAGGPVQMTLDLEAAGATASARGTVPPDMNASGLDLAVNVKAPDLASLSPLIGRALPAAQDFVLAAQVGDAGLKLHGVAVHGLSVSSSLGDVAGDLTVEWAPRASVKGTLNSRVLNLDAIGGGAGGLLPAVWPLPQDGGQAQMVPASPAPADVPPPAQVGVTTPPNALPLAWLRNTDADLGVSIGDLTVGGQHILDLDAHLQLTDGKLALNPFRAQSAQGAIIGGASIDASSDDPPIAVTLRSPAISAEAVAGLLGYPGAAHGNMQVDAVLSGTGQTMQAIQASLNGHLGLAMVNGQVDDSLVQGLIGAALDTAGVSSFGGGNSQVRCFATRLDFTAGVGTVRVLAADTSKLVLDGTGRIDLATRSADLHLRPKVRLGPTEVAAPVSLRGPFGELKASLDPAMEGGRFGLTIGSGPTGPSACANDLALARGGLGGPMPAAVPADQGITIRKPKDLLKGLFH